jgi:murein L,D-transpeptidase YafK
VNRRAQALCLTIALCLLLPCSVKAIVSDNPLVLADQVLVVKSERRLYLLRDGKRYRSYPVALGQQPIGPKEREGDERTPEGRYTIDGRNPASAYFLSLHVSYPSATDIVRAQQHHWKPGGAIMIHGMPNAPKHPMKHYRETDWTDGCIALNNDDMVEVWLLTSNDTPIEIAP